MTDHEFRGLAVPILFDLLLEGAGTEEIRRRTRALLEAAMEPIP